MRFCHRPAGMPNFLPVSSTQSDVVTPASTEPGKICILSRTIVATFAIADNAGEFSCDVYNATSNASCGTYLKTSVKSYSGQEYPCKYTVSILSGNNVRVDGYCGWLLDFYSIGFQNFQKKLLWFKCKQRCWTSVKQRVYAFEKYPIDGWLPFVIELISLRTMFQFFFFGNDIQKVKAKFLAEIYFRELFCKDSCAKRKTCIWYLPARIQRGLGLHGFRACL